MCIKWQGGCLVVSVRAFYSNITSFNPAEISLLCFWKVSLCKNETNNAILAAKGGCLVVSVLAFYSNNPSLNPAEIILLCSTIFKKKYLTWRFYL